MAPSPVRHLLLLPDGVEPADVEALVRMRHSGATRTPDGGLRVDEQVTLSAAEPAGGDTGRAWALAVAVDILPERGMLASSSHPDGLHRAFPDGMPLRAEARAVELLVGLARRLGGAVRVAGSGVVLTPDPEAAVDVVVHAPCWLEPQVVQTLVATEHPEARLASEGELWLDPAGGDVLDAYAVVVDVGPRGGDGVVEVVVHVDEEPEPALGGLAWADQAVAYWVRWSPQDEPDAGLEQPGPEVVAARRRASATIRAIARTLLDATEGVAVDADGLRLDGYSL